MDIHSLIRTPEQVDELFPWLRRDLIRGIPHFISPAWTTDRSRFDPEYWADCWQRIGFRSVTLLTGHHDGYLLYPSKLVAQQPDRDYFGEQVEACRKRDIRVMAYYSLTLDSLIGSEHPDWRVRDMAGRIFQPNYEHFSHYHWLCLNSPYRQFAVRQLEEVVTGYDVDGVWIDILYLPGHTTQLDQDTCFCDHCHRQYSAWYSGQHLLDAAGTRRHDEFRARTYRAFLAELKTMLMAQDRPLALTFNGAGRRRMPMYRMCDELADFLSGEAHNPVSLSVTSRSHRNDGRPFELLSCSEVCWSHNQLKPDTLITVESLGTLIAGGTYTMGITHAPDGRLSEANIERLVRWGKWVRDRSELFADARPVYEMGVLANEGGPADCDQWAAILRRAHLQYNVFMDLDQAKAWPLSDGARTEGLSCYKLILVPANRQLSAEEIRRLREYVEAGGRVLFECPAQELASGRTELEALIGARRLRDDRAYAFYLAPLTEGLAADLPPGDPVLVYAKSACILEPATAKTVAELVPQFVDKVRTSDIQTVPNFWAREDQSGRAPGIIQNRVGDGIVMACAIPVTAPNKDASRSPWPEMLAQNWVRDLLGEQWVSVGGWNRVEASLCRQPGRFVLHFVNHGFGPGEYIHGRGESEILRALPIRLSPELRSRIASAHLAPTGETIELGQEGFTLPELGVHQAVIMEEA
ncbi:MAG: alpha-L-fucosidase [Armatimonadetes bacterium]|nr:alpha-L-fucosidase [Armatimonadota bacterium]